MSSWNGLLLNPRMNKSLMYPSNFRLNSSVNQEEPGISLAPCILAVWKMVGPLPDQAGADCLWSKD